MSIFTPFHFNFDFSQKF